jgi:acyl-CoA synthetase (AMP-forming)/AMP-acid ligase II
MQKDAHGSQPETPETWVALLRQRAIADPGRLAFGFMLDTVENEIRLSYATLDAAARMIGAALQQARLAGERAVLLYQPGPDYVCALMGCLYAGVIAVPVYTPRLNVSYERVIQVTTSSRAAVLLSTDKVLATLDQAAWADLRQADLRWLATDRLAATLADQWQMPDITADSLAILQFTSGSTGHPKGVQLCHRHLLTNSRMIARAMRCTRDSVGVIWLPPYHDMGLIGGLLQPIYSGFPVHLMSPVTFLQRPIRWLEAISAHRGTISAAPNFGYELCTKRVRSEQLVALDLSSWQVAASGAEPIRAETMRSFAATFAPAGFDARAFLPCFGMAETTLYVTGAPHFSGIRILKASREALCLGAVKLAETGREAIELVSSGIADPEVNIRIVDPLSNQVCDSGQIGEIWVAGDAVAASYWERPEETTQTFHGRLADCDRHWLRTGDLGSMVDGELYVTGRIKDLITVRGQSHYAHDIEATVTNVRSPLRPQAAAAFGIEGVDGEQVGLVLELERGQLDMDLAPVAAAVRNAVSRRHQLEVGRLAFVRVGGIPKTSSGKIQRYLTRQRLLTGDLTLIAESWGSWIKYTDLARSACLSLIT